MCVYVSVCLCLFESAWDSIGLYVIVQCTCVFIRVHLFHVCMYVCMACVCMCVSVCLCVCLCICAYKWVLANIIAPFIYRQTVDGVHGVYRLLLNPVWYWLTLVDFDWFWLQLLVASHSGFHSKLIHFPLYCVSRLTQTAYRVVNLWLEMSKTYLEGSHPISSLKPRSRVFCNFSWIFI